jgi:hypothetical protein
MGRPHEMLTCAATIRGTTQPQQWAAVAAQIFIRASDTLTNADNIMCHRAKITALTIANEYNISQQCMEMIYMSPDPYHESFDELIDLRHYDLSKHQTAGLSFTQKNGRLILVHMIHSTPDAKIPWWRTRMHGAWLIKIGDQVVHTIKDVQLAFKTLQDEEHTHATLLFTHPKVHPDISRKGLPIVSMAPFTQLTHEQLNNHWEFSTVAEHLRKSPTYELVDLGQVLNIVTWVMQLTWDKLLTQPVDYIKISCKSFVEKSCKKYLET